MTVHYSDLARTAETPSPAVVAASPLAPKGLYQIVIKRILDVLAVLAGAVLVVPVVAMLALMIWLRDGRAPFYRQERLGLNGRRFTMWKLRSMVIDADEKLADYLADNEAARREWADTQKLKNDPRVTRFGRLIRKSSLDELPQLWNVLKGDMSLVGPRPMMPEQKVLYPGRAYYAMRPGITGFWQISDRNDCSFSARAKFDNEYYNNLSLGTDLRILAGTFRVVLRCTGY